VSAHAYARAGQKKADRTAHESHPHTHTGAARSAARLAERRESEHVGVRLTDLLAFCLLGSHRRRRRRRRRAGRGLLIHQDALTAGVFGPEQQQRH
jgi:hypothetical protein